MISFPYSRFLKCDLHVHTPMDPHWRDEDTRLRPEDDDSRKEDVARQFLAACHREELDVIALTDHNFARDSNSSLLPFLTRLNKEVASEFDRSPLVIFPGFEIEADVGHGCHVLCLLPPRTPPAVVDARVTALGLPPDRRFDGAKPLQSTKRLVDIIDIVQKNEGGAGLVIAAHPLEKKGLFDDDRISEWLQMDEFKNPDLLGLEVPKPLHQMSPGWQRLLRGGDDCDPAWKRRRPIAYLRSSDGYRLEKKNGSPGNHIGYRYTWIKASAPSIEALRQAMLDRESRIRVQADRPEDGYRHPRIKSVRVHGTEFLRRDQTIQFSPNLNCLIGSRGTGKSSLMDYLREALDRLREGDLPEDLRNEIEQRLTDTFLPGAAVEVELQTRGGDYRVLVEATSTGRRRQVFLNGDPDPVPEVDLRSLFPCRFLSQREIDYSVAKRTDKHALRKLLDDFLLAELEELKQRGSDLIGSMREIQARLDSRREMLTRQDRLSTQLRDLQGQLEKVDPLREIMPEWRRVAREKNFFAELLRIADSTGDAVNQLTEDLKDRTPTPPADLLNGANGDLIRRAHESLEQQLTQLRERLVDTGQSFIRDVSGTLTEVRDRFWQERVSEVQSTFAKAKEAAEAQGMDLKEIERIPLAIKEAEEALEELVGVEAEVEKLDALRGEKLQSLREVWTKETRLRLAKAQDLMRRLTPDGAGRKPLVKIVVEHQAAQEAAVRLLLDRIPDKRRINHDDITAVVSAVASAAAEPDSRRSLLEGVIVATREGEASPVLNKALGQRLSAFLQVFTEESLRELELQRIPDRVDFFVHREDGTLAGPIDRVSAGQQGTAVLNVLLASGEEPLLVDTPEEGLDNEGVYGELVPLFRREKERRQVVVVTHNANLPVNGDAEGIIALDAVGYVSDSAIADITARSGGNLTADQRRKVAEAMPWPDWEVRVRRFLRDAVGWMEEKAEAAVIELGSVRKAEGCLKASEDEGVRDNCVGALDKIAVKQAVQDVMEGSREAFDRRREMYGF